MKRWIAPRVLILGYGVRNLGSEPRYLSQHPGASAWIGCSTRSGGGIGGGPGDSSREGDLAREYYLRLAPGEALLGELTLEVPQECRSPITVEGQYHGERDEKWGTGARDDRLRASPIEVALPAWAAKITPTPCPNSGAPCPAAAQQSDFRVTLLGTGTPRLSLERFGPSILVEAGTAKFVFDAGRGAIQRLAQIGVSFADVTGVFLTHLHSDHVVGLPDLWLTGWLISRRTTPLRLWGPPGTRDLAAHLQAAFAFDVKIRMADDKAPAGGGRIETREVVEGTVYDSAGIRITAFTVDHGPVKPAFGYRIDFRGHSVVLSGDTRLSTNLISHAQGVDLLVHEVAIATAADYAANPLTRGILAHHTTPPEAAEVFSRTRPKLAVYSHIGLRPGASDADILPLTHPGYAGPLVLGEDLMRFTVGDSVVIDSARP